MESEILLLKWSDKKLFKYFTFAADRTTPIWLDWNACVYILINSISFLTWEHAHTSTELQ